MAAFRLVVITPPGPATTQELDTAQRLFRAGLPTLHVRKPGASMEQVAAYLAALAPDHRRRTMLHQHHELARCVPRQQIVATYSDLCLLTVQQGRLVCCLFSTACAACQVRVALPSGQRSCISCLSRLPVTIRRTTTVGGIHYREADRPPGVIKAPPGLAGGEARRGPAARVVQHRAGPHCKQPCLSLPRFDTAWQLIHAASAPPPLPAVSTSFHTLADLGVCRGELDYCFLSPIYSSISKADYPANPDFEDRDELAAGLVGSRYPVLALGGVTPDKFAELQELGFAGAALLGGIWQADDPIAAWEAAADAAARLG